MATCFLLGRGRPPDTEILVEPQPLEEGHTGLLPSKQPQCTLSF